MIKKYQVFISSTFLDLQEERLEIIDSVLNFGHIPVGMELFNASDETQWSVIKKRIEQSDYYVLIQGDRYGSLDEGVSYTEKEFDYAVSISKPMLVFLRDEKTIEKLPQDKREQKYKKELERFKNKLKKKHLKFWSEKSDLVKKFLTSFKELAEDKPQIGWLRADQCIIQETDSKTFFYTLDDKHDANFPSLVKGAKKLFVLARTAVNLLGQYERNIIENIKNGCEFRFLFVSPSSDAVKYIYGSNPEIYTENAKKMKTHVESIKSKTGKEFQIKTIDKAPTVSIIYVEKEDGESYLVVQFYFLHSKIGRDRPLFKLKKDDVWFQTFKDEFDILWDESKDWN